MAHRFDSHRRLTWTRALAGLLWLICVPSGRQASLQKARLPAGSSIKDRPFPIALLT